jgi:hypothetical protein
MADAEIKDGDFMKDCVKVLTIGNSFTDSLLQFFPAVAGSAGCKLVFQRANFGGCELERHWSYISAEEQSDLCRIYNDGIKLKTTLAGTQWDFVTIQQASHASWDWNTYLPYGNYIYDYIRQYAPGAEVLIQQTWAYHPYDQRIRQGGAWGFDQTGMYERLTECYTRLAETLDLRIIPTGYAVQKLRSLQPFPFMDYDPARFAELSWPDLPPMAGDPVGCAFWRKGDDGSLNLFTDLIHLNERGRYLQACIWFAFLFERSAVEIKFVPDMIADSDAAILREIADSAVREFVQVKK